MKNKIVSIAAAAALSVAAAIPAANAATTKHRHVYASARPTLQEAWAICKKFTDEGVWSWDQHGQRLQRGGSCMLRYGYPFGSYPD